MIGKIEILKEKRGGDEFFMSFNDQWCVGYATFNGLDCEMDITVEFIDDDLNQALDDLLEWLEEADD